MVGERETDRLIGVFENQRRPELAKSLRAWKADQVKAGLMSEALPDDGEERREDQPHHSLFDYDPKLSQISRNGQVASLTIMQSLVLGKLYSRPNTIVSHDEMCSALGIPKERVKGRKQYKNHIHALREKISLIGVEEEVISAVRELGYMLIDNGIKMDERELSSAAREVQERVYHHSEFTYWPDRAIVKPIRGEETRLTVIQNRLMEKFSINRNLVLTHNQLLDTGWPDDSNGGGEMTLKSHISHLRHKIEPGAKSRGFQTIVSRSGLGYILVDRGQVSADHSREIR